MFNRYADSWQQRSIWQTMRAVMEKGVLCGGNGAWELRCIGKTAES